MAGNGANLNSRIPVVPVKALVRPIATAALPAIRSSSAVPNLSFRSTLIRAQQGLLLSSANSSARLGALGSMVSSPLMAQTGRLGASVGVPRPGGLTLPAMNQSTIPVQQSGSPGLKPLLSGPSGVGSTNPAARADSAARPLPISEFPRPEGDNGRGMHWVPTLFSTPDVVDRFVAEAKEMKIKWMVILNDDAKAGPNDYLVKQLVANGIMPIMRIYTPNGKPIQGNIGEMVKHYRSMGVQYYQLYNEPNLNVENPDGKPNIDRYLDYWVPAAKAVTDAGGFPGIGSLSPGGNFDDMEFLKQMLDRIEERGDVASLDNAWLSMHNYTLNHPLNYQKDSNGFLKFKWYDDVVREKLGRQMPIIGTEGGTFVGAAEDRTLPAITEAKQVEMVTNAYRYMKNREPYNFAYTYWIIANEEGGGADSSFSHHALFKRDGESPLVDALKKLD